MNAYVMLYMFILWLTVPEAESFVACPSSKSCSCLGNSIYCERASVKDIPWKKFPTWVEIISLRQIYDLNHLSSDLLPRLPKLKQLNITNCRKLVSVGGDMASKLPNLFLLRITQSRLETSPHFDSPSYSLRVLILNNNNLTRLNVKTSISMPMLRHLEVNNNKLVDLRSAWFRKGNSIDYLSANGNSISRLDADLGAALPRLTVLRLNKNRMTHLLSPARHRRGTARREAERRLGANATVLPAMPSVRRLELARNRMVSIGSLTFCDWSSLQVLVLRKNFLRTPDTGAFYLEGAGLRMLDLTGNPDITMLVSKWTYGLDKLTRLVAARCGIREVDPLALATIGANLRHLDLSANKLTALKPRLWSSLPKLVTLRLAGNGVGRLPPDAFEGLGELQELSLMANSLTSLTPVTPDGAPVASKSAFGGLRNLTSLDLSYNRLVRLRSVDLVGQAKILTRLDLSGNNLSRIEAKALTQLTSLTTLRMDSSRLICDCQTLSLVHWLAASPGLAAGVRGTNCSQPPAVAHLPLLRLTWKAARVCSVPSGVGWTGGPSSEPRPASSAHGRATGHNDDPRVSYKGNTTVVLLRGGTLSLRCSATIPLTSQDVADKSKMPLASFRWNRLSGQLPVPLSTSTDRRVSMSTNHSLDGRRWSSELRISPAAVHDEGAYQCIFARHGAQSGGDASPRIVVHVYAAPVFTDKPAPVISAMAGETVTIPCAAAGSPPPQSSLRKQGGIEFPAAKDFRISFYQGDPSFLLTNVQRKDAGDYLCESSNAGGSISQPFTLRVNEIPGLTPVPAPRRLLEVGEPAVLACKATGWPFPRIRWRKDGKDLTLRSSVDPAKGAEYGMDIDELPPQKRKEEKNATTVRPQTEYPRLRLSSDDQLLLFSDVTVADAGVYLCRLWNVVGRKEARIVVDVRSPNGRIYPGVVDADRDGGVGARNSRSWLLSNMTGIVVIAVVSCIVVTSIVWVAALFCLKRRLRRKACARAASLVLAGDSSVSHLHRSLPRGGPSGPGSCLGPPIGLPASTALTASVPSLGRLSQGTGTGTPLLSSSIYITTLSADSPLACNDLEMTERSAMLGQFAARGHSPASLAMTTSFRSPVDSAVEEDACSAGGTLRHPLTVASSAAAAVIGGGGRAGRRHHQAPVLRPVGGADVPSSGYNSGNSDYSVGGREDSSSGERLSVHSSSGSERHRLNIPRRSVSEPEEEEDEEEVLTSPVTASVLVVDVSGRQGELVSEA